MRALPLAVGLSAALHAAASAWVVSHPSPVPLAAPAPTPDPVAAPDPDPAPDPVLAVALLDDHTTEQIRGVDATAQPVSHATSRGTSRVSTSRSGPTGEAPATTGTSTGKGHSLMSMRGPEVSTGLSTDFI